MYNSASNLTKSFDYLKVDSQNTFTLFISYKYEILKQVVFFDTRTFFFLKKRQAFQALYALHILHYLLLYYKCAMKYVQFD